MGRKDRDHCLDWPRDEESSEENNWIEIEDLMVRHDRESAGSATRQRMEITSGNEEQEIILRERCLV